MSVSSVAASSLASSVAAPSTTGVAAQQNDKKPVGQSLQPQAAEPPKAALPPKVGQVIDISA